MDKSIKYWLDLMQFFDKYWGCHQIAERSFYFKGYQLPVCARCTGIIIGEALSIIVFALGFRLSVGLCFLMTIPMVLDGTLQFATTYESNNLKRVASGFVFGFAFFQLLLIGSSYVFQLL